MAIDEETIRLHQHLISNDSETFWPHSVEDYNFKLSYYNQDCPKPSVQLELGYFDHSTHSTLIIGYNRQATLNWLKEAF